MALRLSLLLAPLLTSVLATSNDWSQPCFNGECSYDLPRDHDQAPSGTLKISGSPDAITDITEAAGWIIIGCDSNAMKHDGLRLVCKSNDTSSAGCDHLYQSVDVVGKIVRLPEDCGASPFARVTGHSVSDNQTLPDHVTSKLARKPGSDWTPEVKSINLDTDFHKSDGSHAGPISLTIQGTTVQNSNTNHQHARTLHERRSFLDDALSDFGGFNKNKTIQLPHIDVVKPEFELFNESINCPATKQFPAFRGSLAASISVDAHLDMSIGVVAAGSLIPPKISDFAAFAGMNADINGALKLNASAGATIATPRIEIFDIGVPGLDFPGIFKIGPSFNVSVGANVAIDLDLEMEVDLAYKVDNAQMFFPETDKYKSSGSFLPQDTPLKLGSTPNVTSKTVFQANLIPELDLGVEAFGGLAQATIFLNLVAYADLALTLDSAAKKVQRGLLLDPRADNATDAAAPAAKNATEKAGGAAKNATSSAVSSSSTAKAGKTSSSVAPLATGSADADKNKTSSDAEVQGCVSISSGFSVNAGARGTFFSFFNDAYTIPLFNEEWELFKKCLGGADGSAQTKRLLIDGLPPAPRSLEAPPVLAARAHSAGSHFSRKHHALAARARSAARAVSQLQKRTDLKCLALQALAVITDTKIPGGTKPSSSAPAPTNLPTAVSKAARAFIAEATPTPVYALEL